jgi:hypothetical protein
MKQEKQKIFSVSPFAFSRITNKTGSPAKPCVYKRGKLARQQNPVAKKGSIIIPLKKAAP